MLTRTPHRARFSTRTTVFEDATGRRDEIKIKMNAAEEDQVAHRRECECQSGGPCAPEPAKVNAHP